MDDVWNDISRLPSPTSSRFQNFFSPVLRSSRTASHVLPSPSSTPADFISPATSSRFLLADKALSDQFDPFLKQVSPLPTPLLPEKPDKFDPLFCPLTLFRSTDELEQEVMRLAKEQEL
ncbi:hypothetical protein L2E82_45591 [Cichorium intybus]|uniref:Uncharacterized protein n=1 Tax=Cichorium intybus TaxID=13427 RepID=A0ACB8ZUA7_CICIN|nr:hypothetical protein L2E82_45591 [Cichorium intybus]